jgi:hypothetical protein
MAHRDVNQASLRCLFFAEQEDGWIPTRLRLCGASSTATIGDRQLMWQLPDARSDVTASDIVGQPCSSSGVKGIT